MKVNETGKLRVYTENSNNKHNPQLYIYINHDKTNAKESLYIDEIVDLNNNIVAAFDEAKGVIDLEILNDSKYFNLPVAIVHRSNKDKDGQLLLGYLNIDGISYSYFDKIETDENGLKYIVFGDTKEE